LTTFPESANIKLKLCKGCVECLLSSYHWKQSRKLRINTVTGQFSRNFARKSWHSLLLGDRDSGRRFLAGSGQLNYWLVLSSAILGAVLGGTCGCWIGRFGGWPFLLRLGRFFRVPEERLEIKNKFGQNAAKAVFLVAL